MPPHSEAEVLLFDSVEIVRAVRAGRELTGPAMVEVRCLTLSQSSRQYMFNL